MALCAMHRSSDEWRCGRHLVTRKSRAEAYERNCRPSVVRFEAVGPWPTALERKSRRATHQPSRLTALLAVALWAISPKQAPRDPKPRGGVAIDRHGR